MSYYTTTNPHPAEAALGQAIAAFVAEAFGLSGLRIAWVTPAGEAVAAVDAVLERLAKLTEDRVEARGFEVAGAPLAGLARPALAAEEPPAVVILTGLGPELLLRTIAHEAAHVVQFRQHGGTLSAETLPAWEEWADRLAEATRSTWRRVVGVDDSRIDLEIEWHRRLKERA